jgi:type I restriction enzyme S subunit
MTSKVIYLDGLKRIDPKLADSYKRTTLVGGELLLCVRGSTGMLSIAAPELAGGNVTRGIVPIRFDPALMTLDFGFYLMNSDVVQEQIREKTYGTALMQINIRDLRSISFSIPPLKKQEAIATALHELSEETQRLESLYQQKLAALDELKKSLLHQAFSGAL